MIAKVLRSGSGFSGVIEYLYEGKLENRKAGDKQAEVILHSDNLRVPRDWQDVAGRQRMKADFIEQAQSRRLHKTRGKVLIGEHVLSFTQDDMRKLRTSEGVRQVVAEYVKLLGMEKTQHVAIMHRDTDNPHLHLLFNRVTNDRKKFDDSWEKKRAVGAGVALAQKYDLHLVGGLSREAKEPRAKTMRAGMEDLKALQAQQPVLSQARNLHHLEKLATKQGLKIEKSVDQIKIGGSDYKLSDLDAMFQANRNAVAAQKKAAARETAAAPAPDPKQEALRAQERQELFSSLGMGQFEAKAQRMGIDIQKEPEHLTFNGERYETHKVETHLARNFEQSQQERQEHTRQIAEIEAQRQPILRALEKARDERSELSARQVREQQPQSPVEKPQGNAVQAVRPNSIQYHVTPPNQDSTFKLSSTSSSYKEGASVYELENIGGNRYNVYLSEQPYARKMITGHGPAITVLPVFEQISAFNFNAKSLQTVKPAVMQLENGVFRLIEKGEMDYDNVGIKRENATQQTEAPAPDPKIGQETARLIAEKDGQIENLSRQLKELESATAQRMDQPTAVPRPQEVPSFEKVVIPAEVGERDLLDSDSMSTFLDRAESMAWPVQEDEKNVTVNGQTYPKAELETEFAANKQEYHDSLRAIEPLLKSAQNLDQLRTQAYKSGVEMQVLGAEHPKVYLGEERYTLETVEAILKENDAEQNVHRQREFELRPGTDDLFQSTSQANFVSSAKLLGMEVEVDLGRSGNIRIDGVAYDKEELNAVFSANIDEQRQAMQQREPLLQTATSMMELEQAARQARLEDIFAANQAARLAEIRRQFPVLNQAQSTRDFEEMAQKLQIDYKTVQLTEYEIEVRRGKAMVRAGKDAQVKGEEEMKSGRELHRAGQTRLRAGRAEQTAAGDTPKLAEKKGRVSEPVQKARQTILDGQTSASEGVALIGHGRARHIEGRQQIAEGNKIIADTELKRGEKNKSLKNGMPAADADPKIAVEKKKPSLLERMKEIAARVNPNLPGTDYKINRETKLVIAQGKEGAVELQRGDLRAIFEENKKVSLNVAYEQRRGSRILQEARNFSEFYRMAGRLEIKLEDKGRTIEMQGHEYQKNDLKQLFQLNAENPANSQGQQFDHRRTAGSKLEDGEQKQKPDRGIFGSSDLPHGASRAKKADTINTPSLPKQSPRRRKFGKKKKKPDYLQKLDRQEQHQSRSQSHSL